jgi:hypothetical protein
MMLKHFCGSFASFLTAVTSADDHQGGISPRRLVVRKFIEKMHTSAVVASCLGVAAN